MRWLESRWKISESCSKHAALPWACPVASRTEVSEQTVRNIERTKGYNVGTALLGRLATVLRIRFSFIGEEDEEMAERIVLGNDLLILYVRQNQPSCTISTEQLGKRAWIWLKDNANGEKKEDGKQIDCLWGKEGNFVFSQMLPYTATHIEFDRSRLPDLFSFLDRLAPE